MKDTVDFMVERLPRARRTLRIAVVTETYPPEINGVALSAARFVEGLRTRDHDIMLVRPRQSQGDLEAVQGSRFQQQVWQALRDIPFGRFTSYGQLAQHLNHPKGARAVGMAVGRNPWSIIVPCHRVVGADGALTGYAGGLDRKRALLQREGMLL